MKNKRLSYTLKVFVSVFILVFILLKVDLRQIMYELKNINLLIFLVSVFLLFFALYVQSLKWKVLLNPVAHKFKVTELYMYNLICVFYSIFLPGQ